MWWCPREMCGSPSDVLRFLNDAWAKFLSNETTWNLLEASRLASILYWLERQQVGFNLTRAKLVVA
jgi:hypothetical protein